MLLAGTDITITGGTFSNGNLSLKNNTGGTITITGITASSGSSTQHYFTSGSSGTYSIKANDTLTCATIYVLFLEGYDTKHMVILHMLLIWFQFGKSGISSHAEGSNTIASG